MTSLNGSVIVCEQVARIAEGRGQAVAVDDRGLQAGGVEVLDRAVGQRAGVRAVAVEDQRAEVAGRAGVGPAAAAEAAAEPFSRRRSPSSRITPPLAVMIFSSPETVQPAPSAEKVGSFGLVDQRGRAAVGEGRRRAAAVVDDGGRVAVAAGAQACWRWPGGRSA